QPEGMPLIENSVRSSSLSRSRRAVRQPSRLCVRFTRRPILLNRVRIHIDVLLLAERTWVSSECPSTLGDSVCDLSWKEHGPGRANQAPQEHAWPVRTLLGGEDSPAALFRHFSIRRWARAAHGQAWRVAAFDYPRQKEQADAT